MFEYEINPENIKQADIVVGLASFNEEDNIDYPTKQASLGLKKYFPDKKSVIINCDNHSPDDTKMAFLSTETEVPKIYISTPPDTQGKGYNFENLFRKAGELEAKTIICVDADIESITPEWIKYLGEPVEKGFDYVTPLYARHKYDGTITNNICFPLVYGLLGHNIRQPIGGDFALSSEFAKYVLVQPWHRTTEEYGIDIFLSMNSILGDFKICQTGLGAKVHKPSAPKLGPMFLQVVKTAFLMIYNNMHKWKDMPGIRETEQFGIKKMGKAQKLTINRSAIEKKAADRFKEHYSSVKKFLSEKSFVRVEKCFTTKNICITDDLWIEMVYEMLARFKRQEHQTEIIEALRPLYFARSLSFMNDTWEMTSAQAEKLILTQAQKFFTRRDYLLDLLKEA